jgi:hypothetical protein
MKIWPDPAIHGLFGAGAPSEDATMEAKCWKVAASHLKKDYYQSIPSNFLVIAKRLVLVR